MVNKIPSSSELCKLDNKNQRLYKQGKITKTEYNRTKKKIHKLWSKQTKETELLRKLMQKKRGK